MTFIMDPITIEMRFLHCTFIEILRLKETSWRKNYHFGGQNESTLQSPIIKILKIYFHLFSHSFL